MQGLLPGRGFDCLLGEVSALQPSSATGPGTCCPRGSLGTPGQIGWCHGGGCGSWGKMQRGGTCGQQRGSASPALGNAPGGMRFGFVKAKADSQSERLLFRLEVVWWHVFPSCSCFSWSQEVPKESSERQLLRESREVGAGMWGGCCTVAQLGCKMFPRASESCGTNPWGRKIPAED